MCITIMPVTVTRTVTTSRLYDLWVKYHTVGLDVDEATEAEGLMYDEAYIRAMELDGDHLTDSIWEDVCSKFYNVNPT